MENSVVMLSEDERWKLERFIKTGVRDVRLVTRAKVILALDRSNKKDHLRITRISEELGIARQNIYAIRKDFLQAANIEAFLKRKKRESPPVPAKVTGEIEARIIALACSQPPEGYARWSVRLLAKKSVELSIIDSIGRMTVERLLKKRSISLI
jgi:hypothetical protein